MNLVEDTGSVVPEPDWTSLFNDALEIGQAQEHWRRITTELRDRQLMAAGNAHALQRLVVATFYTIAAFGKLPSMAR